MSAALKDLVQLLAPDEIDDLWAKEEEGVIDRHEGSLKHIVAESLFDWPDAEEKVEALLRDSDRLSKLVAEVADAALRLGFLSEELQTRLPDKVIEVPCLGCNTPYCVRGWGRSQESDRSRPQRLDIEMDQNELQHILHRATTLLALTANLLSREDSDLLVQLLAPQPPRGMSAVDFVSAEVRSGKRGFVCMLQLYALIDLASTAFPNAVHYAAACVSLVVCRRPVRAFQLMDDDALCGALHNYFEHLLDLLGGSRYVEKEMCFGIAELINILPLLYWMGDWKHVLAPISDHNLPASIATILLNLVDSQNKHGTSDDHIDVPWDLENGKTATVFIEPLILRNSRGTASNVLRDHPLSWTIAATFELLDKWAACGIPVGTARLDSKVGRGPFSTCLKKYIARLDTLAPQARQIAIPLATALATQTRPLSPSALQESSFLKSPLIRLASRCELCGTAEAATDSTIRRCGGGCRGLAQYCCIEHQKEHWPQHKGWCKMQQREVCPF